jgi:flagellum-specific ATP synthase
LDGHIVLSRHLADSGHFPAIDIEKSISRVMPAVTSPEHQALARVIKQMYASYSQSKDLIAIGAYVRGSDPMLDSAMQLMPKINKFLQQGMTDVIPYDESLTALAQLIPAQRGF